MPLLLALRLWRQWTLRNGNFPPRNLMLGEGKAGAWCQPEEDLVSWKEISQLSDNLSNHLAGET